MPGAIKTGHCASVFLAVIVCFVGCAHYPQNVRLAGTSPAAGYRFKNLSDPGNSDSLQIFMAFSGGGTRAAAFSYGVLRRDGSHRNPLGGQTQTFGGRSRLHFRCFRRKFHSRLFRTARQRNVHRPSRVNFSIEISRKTLAVAAALTR